MDENETVQNIRDGDDKDEDTVEAIESDKGSKKRSWVWNHFIEKKKSDGPIAICKYCKKVLSGNTKGGISHLK